MRGGAQVYVGLTNTDYDCEHLVIEKRPAATGANWNPRTKYCSAEFGDRIASIAPGKYTDTACLFKSGNLFEVIT